MDPIATLQAKLDTLEGIAGAILRVVLRIGDATRRIVMADPNASELLLAAPLDDMVLGLGLAVAQANKTMSEVKEGNTTVYVIDSAEIEVKVAISIDSSKKFEAGGGVAIQAFNVNASYSKSFGFKEEASSYVRIHLSAKPPQPNVAQAVGGAGAGGPGAGGDAGV